MITVYNNSGTVFIDSAAGVTIPDGGSHKFSTIQDALELPAIGAAILDGTLQTDGYAGSTIWVFDERDSFGSVDEDSWRARPINKIATLPNGISNISGDTFLLPAGQWSFSVHAAGKGNIRLVDVTNNNKVLATSTDGDGIITLYGVVLAPSPVYVMFETYLGYGDVNAPKSEGDDSSGTKYTFLAAKLVCVQ